MDIRELTKKVQESAKNRTREENIQLLKDAKIIDESGYYCQEFFSKETVAKDKAEGKPLII
ncbi:conserved hypothetical protein [Hyella patelloides LEGE 07179]|uniref:Uncharacterized protein n=1 Tax=Hyella patelloides LEGE 07179 TaxID=945734 RepID=A0A563VUK7_9CYAN|nr:hypothetical protein [Hyella patelloides]VEP15069.1 conserved hypothetical protein [Hyella patelloides LEGE 07179]